MSEAINPWLGIAGVMAVLGVLQGGVTGFGIKHGVPFEMMRKIVHIVMGLVCAAFPWVFSKVWPVMLLGVVASLWLLITKTVPSLRAKLGQAVNSIERDSYGDVLFCAGVAVLWWLAFGNALLYVIPVLVLTFADALAALVGVNYGKNCYEAVEGKKSFEGSSVFFLMAFLCVYLSLALYADVGIVELLLISTIIALVTMLLEAIAWRGLDNVLIPLGCFLLLQTYMTASVETLVQDLIAVLAITAFAVTWRQRTTQSLTGVLAAALSGFAIWALGGWRWLVPALIMFVGYNVVYGRTTREIWRGAPIYGVLGSTSVSLAWVFLTTHWQRPDFYLPYTLAFAAHFACIGVARLNVKLCHRLNFTLEFAKRILAAWLVFFLPFVAIQRFSAQVWAEVGIGLFGIIAATVIFYPIMRANDRHYNSERRWIIQSIIVGGASLFGLVV